MKGIVWIDTCVGDDVTQQPGETRESTSKTKLDKRRGRVEEKHTTG